MFWRENENIAGGRNLAGQRASVDALIYVCRYDGVPLRQQAMRVKMKCRRTPALTPSAV